MGIETKISKKPFYLGDWCVIPEQCRLQNSKASHHLQPKLMEVLLYFADHPAQVLSTDELIEACWMGQPMTDNPIHKTIAQLRKALGDSSDSPKYIKTIPRKGYILIAKLSKDKSSSNQVEAYWRDQAPFMGAAAFQSHHHSIFFGRQQAQEDLLLHIEEVDHQDNLMVFVSGASGCGKSSFVQAGIIPQLLNPHKTLNLIFDRAIIWRADASNSINELLNVLYQNQVFDDSHSIIDIQQQWQQHPNDLLKYMAVKDKTSGQRTVLFIDQVEQWLVDNAESNNGNIRLQDLLELIELLNSSKHFFIIVAARDEVNISIKTSLAYRTLSASVIEFRLAQLQVSENKNWIQATMQAAGLFFEVSSNRHESLLDLLVNSIERHQCSLSTVQTMLLKLYENRESSKIQYASFNKIGGFKGLINHQIEAIFIALSNKEQQAIVGMFPQLLSFESIINPEAKTCQISWQQACDGLGVSLLTQLINQRLLSTERTEDQVMLRMSETKLPYLWSRLSQWVAANQSHLLKQSEVQFLTARWLFNNKNTDFLMDKRDLSQLKQTKQPGYFSTKEQQQYLADSNIQTKRKEKYTRSLQLFGLVFVLGTLASIVYGINSNKTQVETQHHLNTLIGYVTEALSPQLKAKGQLALLEETHEKLLQVIKSSKQNNPSHPLTVSHASSLNTMGELSFNHRNNDQAIKFFTQSEQIIKNTGNNNNPELLAHLMLSQYWLGYLGFVENEYKQASQYWNAYLNTSLRLREIEPENSEWQLEHSYALNNLGSLSEKTGALKQATEYFSQSIVIKTTLLNADPDNMSLQADLADSLSWQGNIYRKQDSLKLALDAYQNSTELTLAMKSSKGEGNTKLHREALAFHRMASLVLDMGNLTEAHDLVEVALEKSLLLNELDSQNNAYKAELISLQLLTAQIFRHLQDYDSSLKHIQKANQLIDYFKINLAMTDRIASFQMNLKREQAMIFKHFGQIGSAKTALEEGLVTWQDYELSQHQKSQISYAMLNLNMAQILKQEKLSLNQQPVSQTIKDHLDKAWQEIDFLLSQNPKDCQLIAIRLVVAYLRTGESKHPEYIQTLLQSEYRNPEYYQPLIEAQLISFN